MNSTKHAQLPARTTLWRLLLAAGAGLALSGAAGGRAAHAAHLAQAGPALVIRDVSAGADAPVAVPIQFAANGASISTLLFSIDFDQTALTLDPTDADDNGIPDALAFKLPAGLVVSATFDPGDADSEIDVLITGMKAPLPAVPDGSFVTMTFQPRPGAAGGPPTSIRFASTPAPSFGSTTGQSVAGTATGGTVRWAGAPSGPAPTTAPGVPRASATAQAAAVGATPRSSQSRAAPATGAAGASSSSGSTAVAPAAAPGGDSGAAVPAGAGAPIVGGPSDVADPLGAMPFNPAMTAMSQALGEATAAAISNPALDSAGASDSGEAAGTAAPADAVAALPAATGDGVTGAADRTDSANPGADAAGSSASRGWLFAILIVVALAGGWLAYRRRAGGGLHAD